MHANPVNLAAAFSLLKRFLRILPEEYRDFLAAYVNPINLAESIATLRLSNINFILKGDSIIIDSSDVYFNIKKHIPTSVQNMLIPREYQLEREKYLNLIIAFFLIKNSNFFSLTTIEVVTNILQYVGDIPIYQLEAMEVIQDVQMPKYADFSLYQKQLEEKTQKYIQEENSIILEKSNCF